jgi:zinc protease
MPITQSISIPKPHRIKTLNILKPEHIVLDNGINLSSYYTNDFNAIKIDFVFPAGRIFQTKPFQAGICSACLREGSNANPNAEVTEETLDYYGIFVQQRVEAYNSIISFYIPVMYLTKAIPLLYEILFDAQISNQSVEFIKERSISSIKKSLKKPAFLAKAHAMKLLWGEHHPLGIFPDTKNLKSITKDDIFEFYTQQYLHSHFKIYVSGNFPGMLLEALNQYFGQHDTKIIHANETLKTVNHNIDNYEEKIKNSLQTAIVWTKPSIDPNHPDFFNLRIMNTIFGDYFGSRLMTNIREEKAYTYGIYSDINPKAIGTNMTIQTEVGNEYLEDTIKQINLEILNIKKTLVPQTELDLVKNYLSGELLSVFDGVFKHASVLRYLDEMNLDYNYHKRYLRHIQEITPKTIQETAIKYLDTETFHKVYIG